MARTPNALVDTMEAFVPDEALERLNSQPKLQDRA
jgi:hypothetical protein